MSLEVELKIEARFSSVIGSNLKYTRYVQEEVSIMRNKPLRDLDLVG